LLLHSEHYGPHTSSMTRIEIGDVEYYDLSKIHICFVTFINGESDFYAESEDIAEAALDQWESGRLISLDMILLNMN